MTLTQLRYTVTLHWRMSFSLNQATGYPSMGAVESAAVNQ